MGITTEAGAHFDNHSRRKNKVILLDITTVEPCASSNLENEARHARKYLADAVEQKKNNYRGSFPAIYFLLPLAMSTCDEADSNRHALFKELPFRRAKHMSEIHSNESQHLTEGTEEARLRRRFPFILQQALSFHTRHHLFCRQGIVLAGIRHFHSQSPGSVCTHYT